MPPSGSSGTLVAVHVFLFVLLLGGSLAALVSMPIALLAHAARKRP
jgi:O-antigen ligase